MGCTDEASCQVVAEAVGSTFFGASATVASLVITRPTIEAARLKSHQQWYTFHTAIAFEVDQARSHANLSKHGIDFIDAQLLWDDPGLLEIPATTDDEPRYVMIGLIDGKHWTAVITYRSTHVRLISVRRSRTEEVALYESYKFRQAV